MSWYDDMRAMAADDAHLQRNLRALRTRMCPDLRHALATTHVYPSVSCTYTIEKRRIFVCVRDSHGVLLPDCALQHVLLHELAHVLNQRSIGHDGHFDAALRRLGGEEAASKTCPDGVPEDFNDACRRP